RGPSGDVAATIPASAAGGGHRHGHHGQANSGSTPGPNSSTTTPASAMNGPKGKGVSRSWRRSAILASPNPTPATDDSNTSAGSACQPNQAPSAAISLKSPKPMPSLPRTSRNSQ